MIYRISILNNRKEKQILNYFNGSEDLLNICNGYYHSLKQERVDYFDNNGNKRTFSITTNIEKQDYDRILVTSFDSAYTGETFDIRDGNTNALNYSANKSELQSRKMFSLVHIPENSKYGYVVFENKSKHGVKIIYEREFQKFLNINGFDNFRIILEPGLNFNYLSNMMEKGKLKKVRLINYRYSKEVQLSLWGNVNLNATGEEIKELKFFNQTENDLFKFELYKLFFSRLDLGDKIKFMSKYVVDEISFEINHNDSSKTFYLKNKNRMRANIDVSNRLKYVGYEPTYESQKSVALDLIQEILGYGLSNFDEVA